MRQEASVQRQEDILVAKEFDLAISKASSLQLLSQLATDENLSELSGTSLDEEQIAAFYDKLVEPCSGLLKSDIMLRILTCFCSDHTNIQSFMTIHSHKITESEYVILLKGLAATLINQSLEHGKAPSIELINIYMQLQDTEAIKKLGWQYVKYNYYYDAQRCFTISDSNELAQLAVLKGTLSTESFPSFIDDAQALPMFTRNYFYLCKISELPRSIWLKDKSSKSTSTTRFFLSSAILAAELSHQYDYGLAIAHAGLCSGFMFNTMGLDVDIIKTRRKGNSVSVTNAGSLDLNKLNDKKVIILEHDVVSGATLRAVIKAISNCTPAKLDLALNIGGSDKMGIRSLLENIPHNFNRIYTPDLFGYSSIIPSLETLINQIEGKIYATRD